MTQEPVIGIIGGMGPEAAVYLLAHILRLTPAREDSEHIRCLLDNNVTIPSRVRALEGSGPSPAPAISETASRLEACGAALLLMPCHIAHYYYDQIQAAVSIPILNILDLTVEGAQRLAPGLTRVGLLATAATVRTGLYARRFARAGADLILPDDPDQRRTLDLIKAIKTGETGPASRACLRSLTARLAEGGAQAVALGCTELGLAADSGQAVPLVDGLFELARAAVLRLRGRTREEDLRSRTKHPELLPLPHMGI
ncbi:MAG: amino acid racemase [Desulfovibrio sp.]|jgi:aspartate racemase|nr:amino acid racemase [Desulfovibrio sp.]